MNFVIVNDDGHYLTSAGLWSNEIFDSIDFESSDEAQNAISAIVSVLPNFESNGAEVIKA